MAMTINGLNEMEQQVRDLLAKDNLAQLQALLAHQHPADVADLIDRLDDNDQLRVFRLLVRAQAAEVLDETSVEATRDLINRLPPAETAALLTQLPADDAAEILGEDVPDEQHELLAAMSPQEAAAVRVLLHYPPQSAGRLMTSKLLRVAPEMSTADVLARLHELAAKVENIGDIYVTDREDRLQGVVPLRSVLAAPQDMQMHDLMLTRPVTVTPETDQEEAARLVSRYDMAALPVVAHDGRLLGIITVDDVIDILVQEHTEDTLRFGGIEGGGSAHEGPYFATPIWHVVRRRVGWLLLLFVAETATGSVLRYFEDELARVVALSFFIPLLIGTGGNTGAQTVSTLIRGLALGDVRLSDTWRVLLREIGSGLLLGVMLGLVGFGRALLWGSGFQLSVVVGLALIAICTWANTIGSLIPLLAQRARVDPALVSAPLITTLVDATGLAIYLLIAKVILGL